MKKKQPEDLIEDGKSQWFERVREKDNLPSDKKQPKIQRKWFLVIFTFLVITSVVVTVILVNREPEVEQQASPIPQAIAQPPVPPPPPAKPHRDTQLEAILKDWSATHTANAWSISVIGLDSDTRFAKLDANEVFASASIYKLLLMYPLFQKYMLSEARNTTINVFGTSRNLIDCVTLMLKVSDNPCGHAVGSLVGWSKADQELKKLGLDNTKLNSASGSLTTADDTAIFLKALYNDRLFDTATREYVIKTLYGQTWQDGIPAGCIDCKVANKTGDLGVRHDAAIVEYDGGAYVLAIFTDGASYVQIAQLTSRIHEHISGGS